MTSPMTSKFCMLALLASAFLACSLLTACAGKEAVRAQRTRAVHKFAITVVKHLLDRNPDTMQESMNRIFTIELSDSARAGLELHRKLPLTGLSVLKIIQDQQAQHATNLVEVADVEVLGPVDKVLIPVRVSGLETVLKNGNPVSKNPFAIRLVCNVPLDLDVQPQAVKVTEEDFSRTSMRPRHRRRAQLRAQIGLT